MSILVCTHHAAIDKDGVLALLTQVDLRVKHLLPYQLHLNTRKHRHRLKTSHLTPFCSPISTCWHCRYWHLIVLVPEFCCQSKTSITWRVLLSLSGLLSLISDGNLHNTTDSTPDEIPSGYTDVLNKEVEIPSEVSIPKRVHPRVGYSRVDFR